MKNLKSTASLSFILAALAFAASGDGKQPTYLVSTPHTAAECLAALDEFVATDEKLLETMDWGCRDGDHTGYARLHAASAAEAISRLPQNQRAKAKAVRLGKFTPEQIKSFHEK